ncbi:MAG: molybdopterin molybdotransferase MoeA, partial [Planctomycetota bacterium]
RRPPMDGYAVPMGDAVGARRLEVAGRVAAGATPGATVGEGRAVWVNTGAPVPEGTDRVLPVEWCTPLEGGGRVRIDRVPSGSVHVAERASLLASGEVLLEAGALLDPAAVGVLATAGRARVRVGRRPTVAVLGTGTELVDVTETPGPGRIRNSNTAMLRAQVRRAGATPLDLGVAPDEMDRLVTAVVRGLEADVLVLSGGVSRGDRDLVPDALAAAGVARSFHRWAVQPGGPLWFGTADRTLVFGLPGNPAASFVGFEILVVPATRALAGGPFAPRGRLRARYDGPWRGAHPRRRYRPVRLESEGDGRLAARTLPWRGSGDPAAFVGVGALAALPAATPPPLEGAAIVDVVLLGGMP